MRRAPLLMSVVVGLVVAFLVTSVDSAIGTHPKGYVNKNSTAAFAGGFTPPTKFKCKLSDHSYHCTSKQAPKQFPLNNALTQDGNPPDNEESWKNLATPGEFSCEADDSGNLAARNFKCKYGDRTFKVNRLVSVSYDKNDGGRTDGWWPYRPKK